MPSYGNPTSATAAPGDVRELLQLWTTTAEQYAVAHRQEALNLKRRNTLLGVPSVVLSAIVGTTIFAAIQEAAQSFGVKTLLAVLSMTAAALTAVVTFFSYAERATSHRVAAEEYENVSRRLKVLSTTITSMSPADWRNILDGYSQTLEAIGRRVDIPNSMVTRQTVSRQINRVLYGGESDVNQTIEIKVPKLQRSGFPEQLERLYEQEQRVR